MKKFTLLFFLLTLLSAESVKAQLSGTYSIGTGEDYTTLKSAFDDINTNGISANVTLEIVDGHTEDDRFLLSDYAGKSSFELLVRPEAGATNVVLENTGSRHVLELTQVDNITIDGRAGGTGDPVMTIRKITGSFGRTPVKFTVLAGATAKVTSCILEYTGYGVQAAGSGDVEIINNHLILNTGASFYVRGIHLSSFTGNANINGNFFEGTEASGILTYSGVYTDNSLTTYTASNNVLTMVASATTNAGSSNGYIAFDSFDSDDVNIYHNTVVISEGTTVPSQAWMVSVNPSGQMNVKNNIFELNTTSTSVHGFLQDVTASGASNGGSVEYFANNSRASTASAINANYNFYVPGQTGTLGADPEDYPDTFAKLSSEAITFNDAANGDYTLAGTALTASGVRSSIVTSITSDFNGDARDGTLPTKGAHEVAVPTNSTSLYDFEVPGFDVSVFDAAGIINIVSDDPVDLTYTPSFTLASGATSALFTGENFPSGTAFNVADNAPDNTNEMFLIVTAADGITTQGWRVRMTSTNPLSGGNYSVGTGRDYETLESAMKSLRSFGTDGEIIFELAEGYDGEGLTSISNLQQIKGLKSPDFHQLTIRPELGASSVVFDLFGQIVNTQNLIIDGRAGGVGEPIMEINRELTVKPHFSASLSSVDHPTILQYVIFGEGSTTKILVDQNFSNKGDLVIDHCIFDDDLAAVVATKYIQIDGVRNLTISNNSFFNIRTSDSNPAITSAIDLISDEAESVNIYNNAISMNARGTAAFYGIHAQSEFTGDLTITHNTIHFFRGAYGSTGQLSGIVVEGDPSSLAIQNNIISNEGSEFSNRTGMYWLEGTGTRTIEYNNISGNPAIGPGAFKYTDGDNVNVTESTFLSFENNSTAVSMTFSDEDSGDLSLTTDLLDNPDLRTDLDAGVTTDILGISRRSNELRGKGAYEILNTDTEISGFSFEGGSNFNADSPNATITIGASIDVNLAQIIPEITIPLGASINPASNIERDFSNDVTYAVTSESGIEKVWTISVDQSLAGSYTVGSGGDFETLANFINTVDIAGMKSSVTIQILDGHEETGDFIFDNLEEPLYISPVTDVSTATFNGSFVIDNSRVSFLGEDEVNSQQITINGTTQNAAIRLVGTRGGSRFSNLTINYQGQFGIDLNGDGIDVEVIFCAFYHTASVITSKAIGVNGGVSMDEILVSNSKFLSFNGANIRAVEVYNTAYIFNNVIFMKAPGATSPIGIKVVDGAGEVVIDQNTIHISGGALDQISGSVGISAKSTASDRFEITNNIISIDRLTNNIGSITGVIYLTTENTGSESFTVDHNQIDDYSALVDNWLFGLNNSLEKDITDFPNSTSSLTEFMYPTNGDLTLAGSSLVNDDLRSTFLPAEIPFDEGGTSVNYDHDEVERNVLYPSKGAFEYDNKLTNILSFMIPDQVADPVIDLANKTIDLTLTSGADIFLQIPTITVSAGATSSPLSGTVQDFASSVTYTVTSEVNAVSQDWTVTVNAAPFNVDADENEHDELLAANTAFTTFFVGDPNSTDSHTIVFVTGDGDDDNGLFQIDGNNLINIEVFDFEQQNEYSIRVLVTDEGGLSFEGSFSIFVNDLNEAPVIANQSFEVSESESNGFVIGTISVTDPENNPLTFSSLSGEIASVFSVNSDGVLSLNRGLDFEEEGPYEFTVTVLDDGMPNLEATALITVSVLDQNEAPSNIVLANSSVNESNPMGILVGSLSTVDPDDANTHTYSLKTGNTDNASFAIQGDQLVTAQVLDFETKETYDLEIIVTDQGGLTFEKGFEISVVDLPTQVTSIVLNNSEIEENQSAGSLVGAFSTFGEDLVGNFSYSLVTGEGDSDNEFFQIDGNQLLTLASFDFEVRSSFSVRALTTNDNGDQLEAIFAISVTDQPESSDANITAFTLTEQTGAAVIDATTATVSIEVSFATDLSDLRPEIVISDDASFSPEVQNDFTEAVVYVLTAEDGSERSWMITVTVAPNNATDILAFTFAEQAEPAMIQTITREVNVIVVIGTDLSDLNPMVALSDGAILSPTGPQNFTDPVTYTVTAEDGTTTSDWQVTVSEALNTATDITSFTLVSLQGDVVIDPINHTITGDVVFGTDLTALLPTYEVSAGASIMPIVAQDYSSPVTYTVTAEDQTTSQEWLVTLTEAPNRSADIQSAIFFDLAGTVNTSAGLVSFIVPFGTDITIQVPSFNLSEGATISPEGAQDFTNDVTYTVTAQDGVTTKSWVVKVTIAPNTATDILTFGLDAQTGEALVNSTLHTVAIEVGRDTDISSLEPSISVSEGATISPSGPQDFTMPITYVVTAQDLTTMQEWVVNVSNAPNTAPIVEGSLGGDLTVEEEFGARQISYAGVFSDPDGDELTISVASSDESIVTVNLIANEQISINEVGVGVATVIVTANDGNEGLVSSSFTVTVNEKPNTAPIVEGTLGGDLIVEEGFGARQFSYAGLFSDADGDQLTISVASSDESIVTVNLIANEQFEINEVGVGVTTVTATANDGNDGLVSSSFSVTVNESTNNAPVVVGSLGGDLTVEEGFGARQISYAGVFSDADGDELTISAVSSDESIVTVNLIANEQFEINEVGVGVTTVTVTANDGNEGLVSSSFTVTVNESTNTAPVVEGSLGGDLTVEEGFGARQISYAGVFSDADGDQLMISVASSDESIVTVNLIANEQFEINEVGVGVTTVTVTANDGNEGLVSSSFTVTVNESTNTAPVVEGSLGGDLTVEEGFGARQISYAGVFSDADGDQLMISVASSDESIVTVNLIANEQFEINEVGLGVATVLVTANDGNEGLVSSSFTVTVNESINNAPVVVGSLGGDLTVEEGFGARQISYAGVFSDADGDQLMISVASNDESIVTVNLIANEQFEISEVGVGVTTVTISADDGNGGFASTSITVIVNEKPLGIGDEMSISIYPNPTQHFLNIKSNENISASLFDLHGKQMMQQSGSTVQMDIQSLPAGVYIVTVYQGNKIHNNRILKVN